MFLIGFQNQRLVTVHLCPKRSSNIFGAIHDLSALIIQAQYWFALRNEGLLLHTRLGAQRPGYIVQVPHLIPLVGGKGCFPSRQG